MLKAVKFGGSSVAGAAQFQKVREIVLSDPARRVVVASAAGKRFSGDHKLTDLLYLCHAHLTYGVSCEEILSEIEGRFVEIRDTLGLTMDVEGEFAALRARLDRSFPVDALVSRGEAFTSRLLSEYLGYTYVDAADCIFFSPDGRIDRQKTDEAIRQAAEAYGRIVIPGFYGSLPSGKLKVMSRGGSDITGALAAAALGAEVYENWTDVSGILMADPKIVKDPSPIRRITYNELRELAFLGASVLHEEAVLPVKERGIPLNIRNTNAPDDPGTMILQTVPEEERDQDRFITGVAGRRDFTILTLRKRELNTAAALRQALAVLERYRIPLEHISLGLDSFGLVVSSGALGEELYAVVGELQQACAAEDVQVQEGIALIAAVGRKMPFRPGVSGKLFRALGDQGINIRTIAQGADELSIIVGVEEQDFEQAIRVLYHGFAG